MNDRGGQGPRASTELKDDGGVSCRNALIEHLGGLLGHCLPKERSELRGSGKVASGHIATKLGAARGVIPPRSEEHTSELQSRGHLVCRLLLEKKKKKGVRHEMSTLERIVMLY